jgi:hypothetical protein
VGSSSLLVKISCFVLIRKIVMFKNWLIFTGIFIEMGVIEIEYELNKINEFTKSDEEPNFTGLHTEPAIEPNACCKLALCPPSLSSLRISVLFLSFIYSCFCLYGLCVGYFKNFIGKGFFLKKSFAWQR